MEGQDMEGQDMEGQDMERQKVGDASGVMAEREHMENMEREEEIGIVDDWEDGGDKMDEEGRVEAENKEDKENRENNENMVELRHVKKAYKNNVLYTDLNLSIPKGDVCGIVGPNGTGKSVLFKMLCGLARPDGGEIYIDGELLKKGKFPKNIGVILDTSGFLPDETGLRNLEILAGIRGKVTREQLEDLLRRVGMKPELEVKVAKYSLGMKQRLAIAQALMEEPALLILDEPFESVDKRVVQDLRDLLKKLNEENGVTILLASHNSQDIRALCKSVYRIENQDLQPAEEIDLVWDCEV